MAKKAQGDEPGGPDHDEFASILGEIEGEFSELLRSMEEEDKVPEGCTLLPAGTTRRVRVNRDWLNHQPGARAFIVEDEDGVFHYYDEVHFLGRTRMETGRIPGQFRPPNREAFVELTCALAVM